jgi:hypothetical protein
LSAAVEETHLPAPLKFSLALAGMLLLLQGCSATPVSETSPGESMEPVPELTLNLPDKPEECDCALADEADYTFLEKGFSALVAGEHIEAIQYFQRYKRLESSPQADWEADIAIAYDSMLPSSPFYDPASARRAYESLKEKQVQDAALHDKVLMMRDALETFVAMERKISKLETDNGILREDLAKREEAIKRLRELTLGQKEARP